MFAFAAGSVVSFLLMAVLRPPDERTWRAMAPHFVASFLAVATAGVAAWAGWLGRPAAVHLAFGVLFGIVLCAHLMRPSVAPPPGTPAGAPTASPREMASRGGVTIVLLALLAVGIAGPYAPPHVERLLRRMAVVKTPVGEATFGPESPHRQLRVEVKRRRSIEANLSRLTTLARISALDLQYLDVGFDPSMAGGDPARRRAMYQSSRPLVVELLAPLGACAIAAAKEWHDVETIRQALRPVALWLGTLLRSGGPSEGLGREVRRSHGALRSLLHDKRGCPEFKTPTALPPMRELTQTPYAHLGLVYLHTFNGNVEGAIEFLRSALEILPEDIRLNQMMAELLDAAERDVKEILPHYHRVISAAARAEGSLGREAAPADPGRTAILQRAAAGLASTRRVAKNNIAFLLALAGEQEKTARRYSDENLQERDLSLYETAAFTDTLGFVKLAFGGRRCDVAEIDDAKRLLEEALSYAEMLKDQEALRLVRSNLRLAEQLRADCA